MKTWEYVIKYNVPGTRMLNRMGNEGWELCSSETLPVAGTRYIFKRELTDDED